jgi:hypothetical protein
MRKPRWWLIGGITALATLVLLCAYLARPYPPRPPGPGITWDNADQIRPGMSPAEVVSIVGYEPQVELLASSVNDNPPVGSYKVMMWSGTDCDILAYLDRNRRVVHAETNPRRPVRPWYERLQIRLGL